MNLLHYLPPETAHRLGLQMLKMGLVPEAPKDAPSLAKKMMGVKLLNPIGLSAGAEKLAEALPGWAKLGFGFVEAGTVTLHPRKGNPSPRIWRIQDRGVINWLGLPGQGVEPFVRNLQRFSHSPLRERLMVGVSIASPDGALEEFEQLAAACAPYADYLTLNASCPNVSHVKNADPTHAMRLQLKATIANAGKVPVLLKLGPTKSEKSLEMMVDAAMDAGASGIVATNTLPHAMRDVVVGKVVNWPEHEGTPVGGYSGPWLLDVSLWMVERIRKQVGDKAVVMGVGGIQSGADAKRMMDAGADAIQLYTGLIYKGPKLLKEIKAALV